jgi:IPT/TIG domain
MNDEVPMPMLMQKFIDKVRAFPKWLVDYIENICEKRPFTFWLDMIYLLFLLWLGWVFCKHPERLTGFVPEKWGSIPVGVPWFGAVGAVMISLGGVFFYRGKAWDGSWVLWHFARPFVGATLGIISVMIMQAGILATNQSLDTSTHEPKNQLYYLIAFLVGYREITFQDLIRRLLDVLFGGTAGTPLTIGAVSPTTAPGATPTRLTILGSGFKHVTSVNFDKLLATEVQIDSDTQLTVTPPIMAPGKAALKVLTKDASTTSDYVFT